MAADAPTVRPGSATGVALATMLADSAPQEKDDEDDLDEPMGFNRTCALCIQSFPKKSVDIRVLWKHVIDLRCVNLY